jgi:hypothetical protein
MGVREGSHPLTWKGVLRCSGHSWQESYEMIQSLHTHTSTAVLCSPLRSLAHYLFSTLDCADSSLSLSCPLTWNCNPHMVTLRSTRVLVLTVQTHLIFSAVSSFGHFQQFLCPHSPL